MNPKLTALFAEYAQAHAHPTNQLTHKLAIPMIVFHIVAMLDWVTLFTLGNGFRLTAGMVLLALTAAWYLKMSVKLGVIILVAASLSFPLGRMLPWWVIVAIAAGGWLIQLAGHVVWEKKSPSFLTNLVHALVGPAFFVAKLTGDWPVRGPAGAPARAA